MFTGLLVEKKLYVVRFSLKKHAYILLYATLTIVALQMYTGDYELILS